ncbi:MAG: beta-lactamase family protein, partial [Pseudomonadales bacterium]|nr:beta-lactamase family protein [Pseudomonadales bacterium]
GHVDWEKTVPWHRDQMVNAYSTGKGLATILALNAVERGEIGLDDPVARVWPEFATAGKENVTLRMLLTHQGGLPAIRQRLQPDDKYDWDYMCRLLAAEKPFWAPGSGHGYHVNTFGFLVGETLRRATGLPIGRLLQERLTGPLAVDYYWGVPEAEHHRIARLLEEVPLLDTPERWATAFPPTGDEEHDTMIWHTYFNPTGFSGHGAVDTRAWRNAAIPSNNGHGNARAMAHIYDHYLRGFVGKTLRDEAANSQVDGPDIVLGADSRFGLGFQIALPERPMGPNPASFGHGGHGGSLGWADPDVNLAFGYVTNKPAPRFQLSRALRVLNAAYECL